MKIWACAWLASGCLVWAGDPVEALYAAARSHLRVGRYEEARKACQDVMGAANASPKMKADSWLLTAQSFSRESRVSRRLSDRAAAMAACERAAAQEGLTQAERLAVALPAAELPDQGPRSMVGDRVPRGGGRLRAPLNGIQGAVRGRAYARSHG